MTTTERGPSWSERLNPRNWSLTIKLLIVGLVPTLLALGLGALRISDQADVAAELGRSNTLLAVRDQVDTTADSLRAERDAAVRFVAGKRAGDRAGVEATFAASDVEIGKYRQVVASGTTKDAATAASSVQTSSALDSLGILRRDALGTAIGSDEILDRYGAVIGQTDVLSRALLREVSRPEIAGLVDASTAVT